MTVELNYATAQCHDLFSTVLAALTAGLLFLDPIANIAGSGMHAGFRALSGSGFPLIEPRDVIGTLIVFAPPFIGVIAGLWYIRRCRNGPWRQLVYVSATVLLHAMALYVGFMFEFLIFKFIF